MSSPKLASLDSETAEGSSDSAGRILVAATTLFARQGYDGTSTKDICALAEVNIAAIHYHFGSKEGLFMRIIEQFGDSRLASVQRLLTPSSSFDELRLKLELFIAESLAVFLKNPDLCRIVQAEIELLHARSEEVFRRTFVRLFDTLANFLESARKRGLLRREVDARIAAQCIMSNLRQATRAEAVNARLFEMNIRDDKFRNRWIKQTVELVCQGIRGDEIPPPKRRAGSITSRTKK